jgi:hypothetical protein
MIAGGALAVAAAFYYTNKDKKEPANSRPSALGSKSEPLSSQQVLTRRISVCTGNIMSDKGKDSHSKAGAS